MGRVGDGGETSTTPLALTMQRGHDKCGRWYLERYLALPRRCLARYARRSRRASIVMARSSASVYEWLGCRVVRTSMGDGVAFNYQGERYGVCVEAAGMLAVEGVNGGGGRGGGGVVGFGCRLMSLQAAQAL